MSRSNFAAISFVYALLILYSSTIIGPTILHFVPLEPNEAWSRLLGMRFVANGSDQRSDWMGNLGMLVPLGFLLTGVFSRKQHISIPGAAAAFILSAIFILAVKYAQLFFPPRTVTLNYVLAQSLGAATGVLLFCGTREALAGYAGRPPSLMGLRDILRVYTCAVILFFLTPLDFALNAEDIAHQLDKIPDTLIAFPGEGRPLSIRLTVILTSTLATIPIGALLTIIGGTRAYVGRSTARAGGLGFVLMLGVYALSTLLLSGSPSLPAVIYRTAGIIAGAWLMTASHRDGMESLRKRLARLVPWAVPVYLLALWEVNGLLSFEWQTFDQIGPLADNRNFVPLFNYYIVVKSQAAKDIGAHAVMYSPVGLLIWLRRGNGGAAAAFVLAVLLSILVETGRLFRPGLIFDINAIPLAGFAAWASVKIAPVLWHALIESVPVRVRPVPLTAPIVPTPLPIRQDHESTAIPGWRERAAERKARERAMRHAIGDIEDY